ncbi:hypothetical protein EDL79_00570 [Ehrlichia ruminantium]|uniref:Uncharacterized protein n=1 Tax=Ehrlichia ruminantium TaxID=779 RepID=A0AAE6Q9T4_EHRRU|nr:hypothetical protein [Ehrlichia ruminantium]QGR02190.1 hypothetical protein EDL81_00570 [Ehrlichia ruminantium]QGR03112.1 hypothetical protein EDL80_00570 [Ehrlichia ruminantium]QGR04037.1 hypothetical protein EDL79_00570 [Ehrlichia ruminantium]
MPSDSTPSILNQVLNTIDRYELAYNDSETIPVRYRNILNTGFYLAVMVNIMSVAILFYSLYIGRVKNKNFNSTIASTATVVIISSILLLYLSYKIYMKNRINTILNDSLIELANSVQSCVQFVSDQHEKYDSAVVQLRAVLDRYVESDIQPIVSTVEDCLQALCIRADNQELLIMRMMEDLFSSYQDELSKVSVILQKISDQIGSLAHQDSLVEGLVCLVDSKIKALVAQDFLNKYIGHYAALEGKLCLELVTLLSNVVPMIQSYEWSSKWSIINKSIKERADKLCDSLDKVKTSLKHETSQRLGCCLFDILYNVVVEINEFLSAVEKDDSVLVRGIGNSCDVESKKSLLFSGSTTGKSKEGIIPNTEDTKILGKNKSQPCGSIIDMDDKHSDVDRLSNSTTLSTKDVFFSSIKELAGDFLDKVSGSVSTKDILPSVIVVGEKITPGQNQGIPDIASGWDWLHDELLEQNQNVPDISSGWDWGTDVFPIIDSHERESYRASQLAEAAKGNSLCVEKCTDGADMPTEFTGNILSNCVGKNMIGNVSSISYGDDALDCMFDRFVGQDPNYTTTGNRSQASRNSTGQLGYVNMTIADVGNSSKSTSDVLFPGCTINHGVANPPQETQLLMSKDETLGNFRVPSQGFTLQEEDAALNVQCAEDRVNDCAVGQQDEIHVGSDNVKGVSQNAEASSNGQEEFTCSVASCTTSELLGLSSRDAMRVNVLNLGKFSKGQGSNLSSQNNVMLQESMSDIPLDDDSIVQDDHSIMQDDGANVFVRMKRRLFKSGGKDSSSTTEQICEDVLGKDKAKVSPIEGMIEKFVVYVGRGTGDIGQTNTYNVECEASCSSSMEKADVPDNIEKRSYLVDFKTKLYGLVNFSNRDDSKNGEDGSSSYPQQNDCTPAPENVVQESGDEDKDTVLPQIINPVGVNGESSKDSTAEDTEEGGCTPTTENVVQESSDEDKDTVLPQIINPVGVNGESSKNIIAEDTEESGCTPTPENVVQKSGGEDKDTVSHKVISPVNVSDKSSKDSPAEDIKQGDCTTTQGIVRESSKLGKSSILRRIMNPFNGDDKSSEDSPSKDTEQGGCTTTQGIVQESSKRDKSNILRRIMNPFNRDDKSSEDSLSKDAEQDDCTPTPENVIQESSGEDKGIVSQEVVSPVDLDGESSKDSTTEGTEHDDCIPNPENIVQENNKRDKSSILHRIMNPFNRDDKSSEDSLSKDAEQDDCTPTPENVVQENSKRDKSSILRRIMNPFNRDDKSSEDSPSKDTEQDDCTPTPENVVQENGGEDKDTVSHKVISPVDVSGKSSKDSPAEDIKQGDCTTTQGIVQESSKRDKSSILHRIMNPFNRDDKSSEDSPSKDAEQGGCTTTTQGIVRESSKLGKNTILRRIMDPFNRDDKSSEGSTSKDTKHGDYTSTPENIVQGNGGKDTMPQKMVSPVDMNDKSSKDSATEDTEQDDCGTVEDVVQESNEEGKDTVSQKMVSPVDMNDKSSKDSATEDTEQGDCGTVENVVQESSEQEQKCEVLLSLISLQMLMLKLLYSIRIDSIIKRSDIGINSARFYGRQRMVSSVSHVKSLQNSYNMVK